MRDIQVATFLETWSGFRRGLISSDKPYQLQSLSAILESRVSEKYYLSPKACAGILRRAEKRGKELPPALFEALTAVAMSITPEQAISLQLEEDLEPTPTAEEN